MPRIRYRDLNLRARALDTIGRIGALTEEYRRQGLVLTVRQIHYQFVGRDWMPNDGATYRHIQECVNKGRLAGLLDWNMVEDRGRYLEGHRTFPAPHHALAALADEDQEDQWSYRIDLWADQDWRPEVWIEKAALVGVIGDICNELRVDFFATRGNNSQSEQWRAGQRFARYVRKGQRPIVFLLTDHDPTGVDMERDNRERLTMFAGVPVLVQRLALSMAQVEEFGLPENFAKDTDKRTPAYIERFGTEACWELDALEPTFIRDLISDAVGRVRDEDRWQRSLAIEVEDRRLLAELRDQHTPAEDEE